MKDGGDDRLRQKAQSYKVEDISRQARAPETVALTPSIFPIIVPIMSSRVCLRTLALLTFSAVCLGSSAAGAEEAGKQKPILPGYWSYTASTVLPGGSDGKQCVRPDKIDEFMSGPHNHHYKCTYPSRRVADGEAAFDGECVGKHNERYHISVAGTYSLRTFALKGHIQGVILGLPLTLPISIDAKWVAADCPAGAPGA